MAAREVRNGWEYEKVPGGWRKVGPAGGVAPMNPEFPYKGPQAAATLGKTQAEIDAIRQGNVIKGRELSLKERQFQAAQRANAAKGQKAQAAKKTRVMDLMNDILSVRRIKRDAGDGVIPGLGEVGAIGSVMRNIPGTAARDIDGQITSLKSNIARASIGGMRQESPTGAAAGNTSDRDITMFETSRGPIDQGASYSDFVRNMDTIEKRTWQELAKVSPAGARILRDRLVGKGKPADDEDALIKKYLR